MKKTIITALSVSIMTGTATAQPKLPPVWQESGGETAQFDEITRVYLSPERIVWQSGGELIENPEYLLQKGNGQADLSNSELTVFRSREGKRPAILLDFGRELQGGIQIVTGMGDSHKPVRVRVRLGESASEAMSEIDGRNGASNDHAMRDFTMELPWLGAARAGNSGFRFVRIDILDDSVHLPVKEIRAVLGYRDIPYLGSFQSSDPRLDRIWMTGAYTVHLNMQGFLWDGIKRDRLVWVGDMHPEVMTINSVFGYNDIVSRSLDLVRDITPLPGWMNGISSYSIWWLLIHRDWYYYHGDRQYLTEQKKYMSALLRHLFTKIGSDGKETLDGNRFLDWPSSENAGGVAAGLQAMMLMAMNAGAELMTELGDGALARECLEKAALLKKYVPDPNDSKQGAALMALSGLADPVKMNESVISIGGSKNFSTFYGYYMLRAMAKAGDYQGAIERIREYWGAMLDLGATSFWEDFNMDWIPGSAGIDNPVPEGMRDIHGDFGAYCYQGFRHSLCHGWASGPTSWLSEYVLGIQVAEPGFKAVRITPHLGDLDWVEGTMPTPYGIIRVSHRKGPDGKIITETECPKEIRIVK